VKRPFFLVLTVTFGHLETLLDKRKEIREKRKEKREKRKEKREK